MPWTFAASLPRSRDRYGRNLFGQSALIARRLVEAGVRFVTLHYDACDGYGWDSHVHSDDVKNHLMPTFDQALSALLIDLDAAMDCSAETLGRGPGRDGPHSLWPRPDGAGVTGAPSSRPSLPVPASAAERPLASSDKDAAHPVDHPVSPESLAATIYEALGISPDLRLPDQQGRPVPIVQDGQSILENLG